MKNIKKFKIFPKSKTQHRIPEQFKKSQKPIKYKRFSSQLNNAPVISYKMVYVMNELNKE